jgi:glycosyltransferase involved in cell wall biosynthesis
MTPVLSVIVPTYNARDVLIQCIESWRRFASDLPVELVVIEDACRDGTREYLAELQHTDWGRERLQVLHEDDAHELRCTNRGFAAAGGALLLAWQCDMFLNGRWLVPEILRTFAAYPEIGMLALSYGIDFAPVAAPLAAWEDLYDPRHFRSSIGPTPRNWTHLQEVDAVIRPWVVRRSCLDAVGILDEAFRPAEWDEADLAFRIRRGGWAVACHAYERDRAYRHLGSHTLGASHGTSSYREGVLKNGRLFHERWRDEILAEHQRVRRHWRRRATARGWAATASAAIAQGIRRVTTHR